jgi:hypothetical protein
VAEVVAQARLERQIKLVFWVLEAQAQHLALREHRLPMLVVVAVAGTQIVQPLVEALEVAVIAALLTLNLHLEQHLLAVVVVAAF